MIIKAISSVLKTQYLIPTNKDKEFNISVILAAVVNIIINAMLIPGCLSWRLVIVFAVEFFVLWFVAQNKAKRFAYNVIALDIAEWKKNQRRRDV